MSDPGAATDTSDVAVFDDSGGQVLLSAGPLRVLVRDGSKLMRHPLETGATVADHRVFEPICIDLSCILEPDDYINTYQELRSLYTDSKNLTVQTRVDSYPNMFISEIPHDESAEILDTIAIAVKLEQAIFVEPQYAQLPPSKVKKSSNSSTAKTGQKQGKDATPSQSSAAYSLIFGSGK